MITQANLPIVTSGSYTGNDTADRAIPHGLGRIPSMVMINTASNIVHLRQPKGFTTWQYNDTSASSAVTAATATNFYVGNAANYSLSGNLNATVYTWVAL